jgi:hypothetical protein
MSSEVGNCIAEDRAVTRDLGPASFRAAARRTYRSGRMPEPSAFGTALYPQLALIAGIPIRLVVRAGLWQG